jgi:twitching motility protein PilT
VYLFEEEIMDIMNYLSQMVDLRASDLHIKAPTGPVYRIDGALDKDRSHPITPEDVEMAFIKITTESQRNTFKLENELDFSYSIPGVARYRVNVQRQRGSLAIAFRIIPFKIPTAEELGLPDIIKRLVEKPRGLIIISGPTGSGKSTTLAAMIQHLNTTCFSSVTMIEDPIEYLFNDINCVILQRELGADTKSFPEALRRALRHDPDVIIVGEMRDYETVSTAIAAAETGHLVIGTLHTIDAPQTVDRLLDVFPPAQQHQVRAQFSQIIEAVVCQTLLPLKTGKGRVGAFEIMLANTAVRHLIREGKTHELQGIIQMNMSDGMQLLDSSLAELVLQGLVSREEAMLKSSNRDRLKNLIDKKR